MDVSEELLGIPVGSAVAEERVVFFKPLLKILLLGGRILSQRARCTLPKTPCRPCRQHIHPKEPNMVITVVVDTYPDPVLPLEPRQYLANCHRPGNLIPYGLIQRELNLRHPKSQLHDLVVLQQFFPLQINDSIKHLFLITYTRASACVRSIRSCLNLSKKLCQ